MHFIPLINYSSTTINSGWARVAAVRHLFNEFKLVQLLIPTYTHSHQEPSTVKQHP